MNLRAAPEIKVRCRDKFAAALSALFLLGFATSVSAQVNASAEGEPPWLFRAGGSIELGYTDNVLVTDINRESDFIGTVSATGNLKGEGARGFINATATLGYDSYVHKSNLNSERYSGLLASNLNLIEDSFSIAANASTQLQETSTNGAEPASERSIGQNQAQVISYSTSPQWRMRLGNAAQATLSYTFSGTKFVSPPVGDDVAPISDNQLHTGRIVIANGPSFTNFTWTLSGAYEETKASNTPVGVPSNGGSNRSNGEAVLRYRISQALNLTATGGYDDINESTLAESTHDPYGRVGFNWVPSSRTNIDLQGGYRYRGPNFVANISYAPREWFTLRATYNESIETQQRLIAQQLNGLVRDETGNLIDPITGLDSNVTETAFDLTDTAFRSDAAELAISGRVGRSTYQVAGNYETRNSDGSKSEQWSGTVTLGRQLTPRLSSDLTAQYSKTQPIGSVPAAIASAKTVSATVNLDYRIGPTVYASLSYLYQKRTGTAIDTRENFILLSLVRRY